MNAGARLAIYGLGLVVAFGGAFGVAAAVVPGSVVDEWEKGSDMKGHQEHGSASAETTPDAGASLKGLTLGSGGYVLSAVEAPSTVGEAGALSFQIQTADGKPVVEYTTEHDKDLHLIVTRSDGSQFRHVHPELDHSSGTWSLPWQWAEPGSYRVFADFTTADAEPAALTLTRTVEVSGDYLAVSAQPSRVDQVAGYTVSLDGEMVAGSPSELTITLDRDGEPVTTLEPYLGAFGHLVALRQGDLAFLHVHADGDAPQAGQTAGPAIVFFAEAPTAGRYLLYLDFQVNGEVHTAEFVLDAAHSGTAQGEDAPHPDGH